MARILVWCSRFWPRIGGIQVLAARLLPALQARRHELMVITQHEASDRIEQDQFEGIPVYSLPFGEVIARRDGAGAHDLRRQVLAIKQAFKPQLLHVYHMGPEAFFELQTRAEFPVPMVCSLHNVLPMHVFQPGTLFHRLLHAAHWVTAPSQAVLRHLRRSLPEVAERSSAIPHTIDFPALRPAPLAFSPVRVLCLGRLVEQKGFDLALAAFPDVRARHPTARMVVAGDGPLRARLEQQARDLGIADAVEFTGWVAPDAVPALINTTTLLLMPSRIEGLPLVSVQAAQMARPLIASRAGGLPEVVRDGETGLLIDAEDRTALTHAMLSLLADPARAARMGQAARAHVAEQFSWDRFVDTYDRLFTRLLAQDHA